MNQGLKVSKWPGSVVVSYAAVLMIAVQINPLDCFEYHKKDLEQWVIKGLVIFLTSINCPLRIQEQETTFCFYFPCQPRVRSNSCSALNLSGVVSWHLWCALAAEDETAPVSLSLPLGRRGFVQAAAGEQSCWSLSQRPAMVVMFLWISPAQQITLSFFRLKTAQEGAKCIAATAVVFLWVASCWNPIPFISLQATSSNKYLPYVPPSARVSFSKRRVKLLLNPFTVDERGSHQR